MMHRLAFDLDEWTRLGAALMKSDPKLYAVLLEVASAIAAVHDDPLSVSLEDAEAVPGLRELLRE
jgi:hypothetical protein